jgi:hypothetical protein
VLQKRLVMRLIDPSARERERRSWCVCAFRCVCVCPTLIEWEDACTHEIGLKASGFTPRLAALRSVSFRSSNVRGLFGVLSADGDCTPNVCDSTGSLEARRMDMVLSEIR